MTGLFVGNQGRKVFGRLYRDACYMHGPDLVWRDDLDLAQQIRVMPWPHRHREAEELSGLGTPIRPFPASGGVFVDRSMLARDSMREE